MFHFSVSAGSHVIYSLQETRRYKVISIDNHHNSTPKALLRVAELARNSLPADASEQDKESAEIDAHRADLTKPDEIRAVFEKYGKGGIWGVVHIAVRAPRMFSEGVQVLTAACYRPTRRSVNRQRFR